MKNWVAEGIASDVNDFNNQLFQDNINYAAMMLPRGCIEVTDKKRRQKFECP